MSRFRIEPVPSADEGDFVDTYKDNSYSDRCQTIMNGITRAMSTGELVCLFTGETFGTLQEYNKYVYSRKVRNMHLVNTHLQTTPPTQIDMSNMLETCKGFLEILKPLNAYVDLYSQMLKADYDYERSHLLNRLSYNDEWDRFRLENEGVAYFGIKLASSQKGIGETFVKADKSPLPYSHMIVPGQSVWISAEDAAVVDPVDNRITAVGEVSSIGRESIICRGLQGLPFSKNDLYRIDFAVTTLNLDRMQHALGVVRRHHEVQLMTDHSFAAHLPMQEGDERRENFGILEPGTPLAKFFFMNIKYSLAKARESYRLKFGATPPPGMPQNYTGFNSYDPPVLPEEADSRPLTPEELNQAAQMMHPLLKYSNMPGDCNARPLDRSQHKLNSNQLSAVIKVIDEGRQLTLIQGPPGTGKTTTAISIICEWVKWYHWKILATAHSNKGVDNLLQGLVAKGIKVLRVGRGGRNEGSDLADYSLETLVDRSPLNNHREKLAQQLRVAQRAGASQTQIREIIEEIQGHSKMMIGRSIVKECEVICATCVGVGSPMMQGLQFDLVLVDEATQAVEPAVLIPITRGARQVVMIGDQAQLPPTCKCAEACMMGLDISLFDRLIGNGMECHMLDTQYRMHPTISCFPSWRFYNSKLMDGIVADDRKLPPGVFPTTDSRVCFLQVSGEEAQAGTSKLNKAEAACILWCVQTLINLGGITLGQIGIITPYAAQVRILTQTSKAAFGDGAMGELEVHSVAGSRGARRTSSSSPWYGRRREETCRSSRTGAAPTSP